MIKITIKIKDDHTFEASITSIIVQTKKLFKEKNIKKKSYESYRYTRITSSNCGFFAMHFLDNIFNKKKPFVDDVIIAFDNSITTDCEWVDDIINVFSYFYGE